MTGKGDIDLSSRQRLWLALSALCLDTEITDADLAFIVRTIREEGFTFAEAEHIAFYEVFPVTGQNLFSITGEWACFDEDLLFAKIEAKRRNPGVKWVQSLRATLLRRMLKADWQRLKNAYNARGQY